MGLIRFSFSFVFGTFCGAYVAQNYNVPNIRNMAKSGIFMAKHVEEVYRKPEAKNEGDSKNENDKGSN
ncbi:hypothetical protein CsatB_011036 [Cannabis sativa]|uniref:Uncharacterized protein n=1 Tax=Cannabis sativa TaxID=3483 RepID=A0A803RAD6_CANSA